MWSEFLLSLLTDPTHQVSQGFFPRLLNQIYHSPHRLFLHIYHSPHRLFLYIYHSPPRLFLLLSTSHYVVVWRVWPSVRVAVHATCSHRTQTHGTPTPSMWRVWRELHAPFYLTGNNFKSYTLTELQCSATVSVLIVLTNIQLLVNVYQSNKYLYHIVSVISCFLISKIRPA